MHHFCLRFNGIPHRCEPPGVWGSACWNDGTPPVSPGNLSKSIHLYLCDTGLWISCEFKNVICDVLGKYIRFSGRSSKEGLPTSQSWNMRAVLLLVVGRSCVLRNFLGAMSYGTVQSCRKHVASMVLKSPSVEAGKVHIHRWVHQERDKSASVEYQCDGIIGHPPTILNEKISSAHHGRLPLFSIRL